MQQPAPIFRIYRLKWYWHVTALFPLLLGIGFAAATWIDQVPGRKDPNAVNWIVALGLIVIGAGLSVYLFTASVRFTENAIEQRTLFGFQPFRSTPLLAAVNSSEIQVKASSSACASFLERTIQAARSHTVLLLRSGLLSVVPCAA